MRLIRGSNDLALVRDPSNRDGMILVGHQLAELIHCLPMAGHMQRRILEVRAISVREATLVVCGRPLAASYVKNLADSQCGWILDSGEHCRICL
jgi:hypothetical protein